MMSRFVYVLCFVLATAAAVTAPSSAEELARLEALVANQRLELEGVALRVKELQASKHGVVTANVRESLRLTVLAPARPSFAHSFSLQSAFRCSDGPPSSVAAVPSPAHSPLFAVGCNSGDVLIFSLTHGDLLSSLRCEGLPSAVTALAGVAHSHNDTTLVSGFKDGSVSVLRLSRDGRGLNLVSHHSRLLPSQVTLLQPQHWPAVGRVVVATDDTGALRIVGTQSGSLFRGVELSLRSRVLAVRAAPSAAYAPLVLHAFTGAGAITIRLGSMGSGPGGEVSRLSRCGVGEASPDFIAVQFDGPRRAWAVTAQSELVRLRIGVARGGAMLCQAETVVVRGVHPSSNSGLGEVLVLPGVAAMVVFPDGLLVVATATHVVGLRTVKPTANQRDKPAERALTPELLFFSEHSELAMHHAGVGGDVCHAPGRVLAALDQRASRLYLALPNFDGVVGVYGYVHATGARESPPAPAWDPSKLWRSPVFLLCIGGVAAMQFKRGGRAVLPRQHTTPSRERHVHELDPTMRRALAAVAAGRDGHDE